MTTHPMATTRLAESSGSVRLPDGLAALIQGAGLGFVATVNDDGTPNLSPKGSLKVVDHCTLAFGDIASPTTIANIRRRPEIEVNVVHPATRQGFRFKGRARVSTERSMIDAVLAGLDRDFGINEVVVIDVNWFAAVRSPRYTMYDATVEDTARLWGAHIADEVQELLQLEARLATYVDAWHSHDPDIVASLHTHDTEFVSKSFGRHVVGREEFVAALKNIFRIWPDLRFEVRWHSLKPDVFVTEATASATQAMPLTFDGTTVEPTGRRVRFDFVDIFEFRDDLVRSKRTYFDPLAYIRAAMADDA